MVVCYAELGGECVDFFGQFVFFSLGVAATFGIVAFLWRTGLVGVYCISGEEGEKARICGCSPQQHIS